MPQSAKSENVCKEESDYAAGKTSVKKLYVRGSIQYVMLTMLILGFLVTGIFSNEFSWKADAIFFTAVYGRNKAVAAKIKAGFTIVTAVYWAVMLPFVLIFIPSFLGNIESPLVSRISGLLQVSTAIIYFDFN